MRICGCYFIVRWFNAAVWVHYFSYLVVSLLRVLFC